MPNIFDPSEQVPGGYQLLVNKYPSVFPEYQNNSSEYGKPDYQINPGEAGRQFNIEYPFFRKPLGRVLDPGEDSRDRFNGIRDMVLSGNTYEQSEYERLAKEQGMSVEEYKAAIGKRNADPVFMAQQEEDFNTYFTKPTNDAARTDASEANRAGVPRTSANATPAQNTTVSNYPSFEQASEYINPVVTREGNTVLVNRYGVSQDGTTPVAGDTGTGMVVAGKTGGAGGTGNTGGTGGTGGTGETENQRITRSGLEEFTDILTRAGLAGTKDSFGKTLIDYLNEGIKNDEGISTIKNTIRNSEAYKLRFPGMADLQKRNIAVNEGTYIEMERGFIETLVAHGLDPSLLATTAQMGNYISKNVSPRLFEERVTLAADRVKNNPDVMDALYSYYPTIARETAMTYLLNPTVGIDLAKKQVRTAELGAAAQAASKQLFGSINTTQLESMIPDVERQTYGQLKSSFGQAATLAETQRTMAEIEGNKNYSNLEAVEAQVQGKQTAITESEKRALRARARFSGTSGIDRNSLSSTTNTL